MTGKLVEFMWPALVANKILNKRLGSSNFIADYPSNNTDIPLLGHDQSSLSSKSILNDHKDTDKYKIFVSTWNVGGIAPDEGLNMEDLLETSNNSCDIYVLGFQEIVPLKASNVLGYENNKISTKWNSIIGKALNKSTHHSFRDDKKEEDVKNNICCNNKEAGNNNNNPGQQCEAPQDFECIISKQMVGILISVWAKRELRPFIQHSSVSRVGCGIMGCLGNKGSVSVRFVLHETSFCFVCCHLASGGREGDEKHRNSNVAEIFSRSSFPRGPMLDLPRKILDHELLSQQIMKTRHVILLGDLNYRISLPEETTRLVVENEDWDSLLEYDQLTMELMRGNMLKGWHEGAIKFAPTYKYCPNSDMYYGCCYQGKNAAKKRAPAWCDRIIWFGNGLKQIQYARCESKLSDHRPVKTLFIAQVRVSSALKCFQSLFLSERFEQIKTHFGLLSNDEFVCKKQLSFRL
ncbi:type IV inositol polyphosphate 5-phosphatase 9-like isoform X1 [Glycine soja]|uniref:type IV inositol polyphosphate 5-phosphatase 9 isoform X1 n=1 Tax=Glycine max TaxID=3847 RepID=UPI0007191030|nr:type IV inositol polyphosphate 5-phosphatase 9 isoform X1 [Glycine max]XP_028221117.1 type IV inositol polyphosphate 5-phosphatase 9-like isoform X1 [Glycine soja]|eukprot:XP_014627879.1 type IV inositol polyphosphate 5-phosphatase 9 isoform X1 [Glycine max]